MIGKLIVGIVLGYLSLVSGSDILHDGWLQGWQHPTAGCHFVYVGRTVAWTWRRTNTVLCWRLAELEMTP